MDDKIILSKLNEYISYLRSEERSENTIMKYTRDLKAFFSYIEEREMSKKTIMDWKEYLINNYAPASVNSMIAAYNGFFEWMELPQYKVKSLKIQRAIFANPEKELSKEEYFKLIQSAERNKNERLALLLQTICSTGIRVSELCYVTVEAAHTGRTMVDCKGKTRIVFLPCKLCRTLCNYCKKQCIKTGIIFCTKTGMPLHRSNIWREMKALYESSGVAPDKIFPHNLRHLFARTFYHLEKDLSRLADLLGHSNINTTRIYTMESGQEHVKQLEKLHLLVNYNITT